MLSADSVQVEGTAVGNEEDRARDTSYRPFVAADEVSERAVSSKHVIARAKPITLVYLNERATDLLCQCMQEQPARPRPRLGRRKTGRLLVGREKKPGRALTHSLTAAGLSRRNCRRRRPLRGVARVVVYSRFVPEVLLGRLQVLSPFRNAASPFSGNARLESSF